MMGSDAPDGIRGIQVKVICGGNTGRNIFRMIAAQTKFPEDAIDQCWEWLSESRDPVCVHRAAFAP